MYVSLRNKLLLINILAMSLASVAGAVLISWGLWTDVLGDAKTDALTRARVVADNAAPGLLFRDLSAVSDTLKVLNIDQRVLYVAVFDGQGKLFVQQGHAPPLQSVSDARQKEQVLLEDGVLEVSVPIREQLEAVGRLVVCQDAHAIYRRVVSIVGIVLLGTLLAAGVGSLLIYRLLPRILRPLSDLAALMRSLSHQGDYSHRAEIIAHDEVGELAESFNQMIEKIERSNHALSDELRHRREAEIKLDHLAHYDNVTQLTNRHYFEHHLRNRLHDIRANKYRAALMFIDLDDFKRVNDTYGHHVGDMLLRSAAERMRHSIRAEDNISRLGGDEFAILLAPIGERAEVDRVAQSIIEILSRPVRIEGKDIFIGVSIGSVLLPDDTDEFNSALRFADMAMYEAKHQGKNNHQEFRTSLLAEQG